MAKYLYGASVQGIQSFIFETNKLKEIVGASQLIDNINEKVFAKFCLEKANHNLLSENVILNAAGNIKYIVDENTCKMIVRDFPKYISNYAPGITISQAVIPLSNDLKEDIDNLEIKLKIQRNKAQIPMKIGFMGLERAKNTGQVAYTEIENRKGRFEIIDLGTLKKIKLPEEDTLQLFKKFTKEDLKAKNVPFDIEKITENSENSWLAVIHADGNGLGNVLQNMAKSINNSDEYKKGTKEQQNDLSKKVFSLFSEKLKKATEQAAQNAFNKIIQKNELGIYPFRPAVLGGDDLTVIIRADLAFDFTKEFLTEFENQTENYFKEAGLNEYEVYKLTACAGIAYIKDNYPFHYGVHLAESLTKEAKSFSKGVKEVNHIEIQPSSLSFYKVQASFIEDLKDMKKRTHYAEQSDVRFDLGPYLLQKQNGHPHVGDLDDLLTVLKVKKKEKSKGVSKLRQWISELYKDNSKADFMRSRIVSVNNDFAQKLGLENPYIEKTIKDENKQDKLQKFSIYKDLIDLHTFNTKDQ